MRSDYDAIRSLARHTATILDAAPGEEVYDIQIVTEGGNFTRPGATIMSSAPTALNGSVRVTEATAAFVVNIFPPEAEDAYAGQQRAYEICGAYSDALTGGLGLGRPWLVPLFDYDGVPPSESSDTRRPQDFMKVTDLTVRPVQSPSVETAWTVNVEVRLGWRRNALLPSDARTTKQVPVHWS